ncbi:sulfite exporter TauE/SafE family protein [Flavobacterium sp. F372]|uniref:Probable membrane transporter protein n=1 Tax=Flavobacterium bernardetii TaxID=2813823 RepID=A0ABR7IXN7_9FLAO|nr:sulfite exporter TauE/SafE family protein [Flavobacterium bernardetii]MBC5834402.1 sulfite exporter TauE/SafE family protein [Flavobacterium bernardetii]NHF69959.1 sulfite exporter TauE/SafE family protein [Flavobacterium bernardetii]
MEYILIPIVALLASALTFFSGFGLGTLLLPAFALFFPVDVAIALTAIVHFLNNAFKLLLVKKQINWKIALRFGLPALLFSFLGAFLLDKITNANILTEYSLNDKVFQVTLMKIIVAFLLIFFALFELIPKLKNLQFPEKYLPIGGILSGFFGGLSGHQGALRSAFLTKVGLSKEAFIATGVIIACMIDVSRMSVYFTNISKVKDSLNFNLIFVATLAAFIGVYFGNKLVKKITINTIQKIVAFMIILFAIALGLGIV